MKWDLVKKEYKKAENVGVHFKSRSNEREGTKI